MLWQFASSPPPTVSISLSAVASTSCEGCSRWRPPPSSRRYSQRRPPPPPPRRCAWRRTPA
ncbi:hypothetical protein PF011_g27880 [Phytophthora fragariae]|uniref:Uncharacterized protein n=1 Tax=Phytophthora fragariae TaxID=53985 RepID=A0A6A3HA12_9STRA|nr:hypothetical protein PF011_g27880 [Phytophthora fragariae]